MTLTRKWSLLAAAAVVAILAAGWFLAVGPKQAEASRLKDKTTAQESTNQELQQQIQTLKAQALDLPKQQARLAAIRKRVPDNPALPRLIRDLSGSATKAGLSLDSLTPASPVVVLDPSVGVAASAPAASPSAATSDEAASASGGEASTSTAPSISLYYVPVTLKASGEFAEVEQFINKLEGLQRSLLVTGLTIEPGGTTGEDEAAVSSPVLDLTLTGRIFLSPPAKDLKNWPGATASALKTATGPQPAATAAPAQ